MRNLFAALAVTGLALALGGCNLVVADHPLFTAENAAGAPLLRTGLWNTPKADCAVDEFKPVADWPDCAGPIVIRKDEVFDPQKGRSEGSYVFAAGDPRIIQAPLNLGGGETDTTKSTVSSNKPLFAFIAVEPQRMDDQGRIVEFKSWLVQCGPPPPEAPKSSKKLPQPTDFLTRRPLPGLKPDRKSGMCLADAQGPVRNAAAKSRAWTENLNTSHWVRDEEK